MVAEYGRRIRCWKTSNIIEMNWLLERLKEQNTWRGLILLATAFGVKLDPDQSEAIIAGGLAIVGLINVFSKERKPAPALTVDESKLAVSEIRLNKGRVIGQRGNPAK